MSITLPAFQIEEAAQNTGLVLHIRGTWSATFGIPPLDVARALMADFKGPRVLFIQSEALGSWGSPLAAFLFEVEDLSKALGFTIQKEGIPPSLQRLLNLARAVPHRELVPEVPLARSLVYKLGAFSISIAADIMSFLTFVGEVALSLGRFIRGARPFRARDFWLVLQECGAEALPIVTLISFLVGLTMAFVGSIQLSAFGASIYVANLVGLVMVREMGATMAGIILCGRTGAAFASQIGSMKVSEEIDALRTLGISPIDYIVLPRLLALFLMMPLLCLYADFIGILGGLSVSMWMLDLSLVQYVLQTQKAITLMDFSTGIMKSTVFGALVALTGCLRGMQCGSNAAAIGASATSAVVTGITSIVVADAIFAVIFHVLDI